jgi:hypothetical protein
MRDRYNEADEDRRGQDAIRDGDIEESHHRHPNNIQNGHRDANAFCAKPV